MIRRPGLQRLFNDSPFLHFIDRMERQLAKVLALLLLLVVVMATLQLGTWVVLTLLRPDTEWLGDPLTTMLGDLLNLLIALEVLQNLTAYLRRHVVQIELVLLTAITAVARKVIVLPPSAEGKPQLLVGLGLSVMALAFAYWLVRQVRPQQDQPRTGPATPSPEQDP